MVGWCETLTFLIHTLGVYMIFIIVVLAWVIIGCTAAQWWYGFHDPGLRIVGMVLTVLVAAISAVFTAISTSRLKPSFVRPLLFLIITAAGIGLLYGCFYWSNLFFNVELSPVEVWSVTRLGGLAILAANLMLFLVARE